MTGRARTAWLAALAGVAASSAGLGTAELVAGIAAPTAGPLVASGSFVIDISPAWLREFVIALFGTGDKAVLLVSLGVLLAVVAAAGGVLEQRRPPLGRILLLLTGLAAAATAVSRAGASPLAAIPSLLGTAVAVLLLPPLTRRLRPSGTPAGAGAAASGPGRRDFLVFALTALGLGAAAALGGRLVSAGARTATAARSLFALPKPATPAPAIPASASLPVPGITPLITPNADFYRVDTSLLFVPRPDPADWSLRITGMVDREVALGFDELIALPLEESVTTLVCVSNPVGGDLAGTARWLGYPIRALLERAGPHPDADMVLSRSVDGFTAGTPIQAMTDGRNAIVAVGMNGEPLPFEHGYPARLVVPGLYGYVSATKWVTELEVTRFDRERAYWTQRGWSERGPVKLSSRIDVPRAGQRPAAGTVMVGGVAWSPHAGIAGVEVRVDDGPWHEAQLGGAVSADTWRQWAWSWPATAGRHRLTVRATDAAGTVQTPAVADPVPDGATGWHSIVVAVA